MILQEFVTLFNFRRRSDDVALQTSTSILFPRNNNCFRIVCVIGCIEYANEAIWREAKPIFYPQKQMFVKKQNDSNFESFFIKLACAFDLQR